MTLKLMQNIGVFNVNVLFPFLNVYSLDSNNDLQHLHRESWYFLTLKFCFTQQFLKVWLLSLAVYNFDAFKSWHVISLKDFNEILNWVIYSWIIWIDFRNKTAQVFQNKLTYLFIKFINADCCIGGGEYCSHCSAVCLYKKLKIKFTVIVFENKSC